VEVRFLGSVSCASSYANEPYATEYTIAKMQLFATGRLSRIGDEKEEKRGDHGSEDKERR
jgi:hypothetical protein